MVNRDVRADGRAHAVTKRTRKDGSLIDVELLAAPVLVGGEAIGTIGTYPIYHDVSELQRRRQYLESLLELSATAIVTVGLDDNVTSWDGAAETLFRYTRAARRSGATSTTSWLVSTSCGPRLRASPRAWRGARRSSTRLGGPARTARWWMSTYAPRRSCWGWYDYVSKPVHLDSLAEALSRCAPRAVLDPEALERLCATAADREFAAELVDAYLRDAPALLETLRGPDAGRAAHTLKSTARVLGAARLAELCQELEALDKADRLGDAAGLLGRIDAEHARVRRALQELT
jgi:HPt (histidine-containing phosphotransfer) domain-containing protein